MASPSPELLPQRKWIHDPGEHVVKGPARKRARLRRIEKIVNQVHKLLVEWNSGVAVTQFYLLPLAWQISLSLERLMNFRSAARERIKELRERADVGQRLSRHLWDGRRLRRRRLRLGAGDRARLSAGRSCATRPLGPQALDPVEHSLLELVDGVRLVCNRDSCPRD